MQIGPLTISFKQHHQQEVKLPVDEVAYAEDAIYQFKDIPKYNPDDLIGKKGHAIYRKMMIDEQVKAVVHFKRDSITSREYILEISDAGKEILGEEEVERRVNISNHMIDRITGSFTDKLNGMLTSMWQGFSMTEQVYDQFEYDGLTYWGINRLKLKPFDTFEFIVDEFGNSNKVIQQIAGNNVDIDITKFIHFVHNPDYDEQYGQSELREAYRAYFSKDMAITFWNMYLERHASGTRWIQPKENQTIQRDSVEYADLVKVLDNSVNGTGMILPGKVEMKMEYPSNKGDFKIAVDTHDLAIAKALLVPNLMGITPTGQTGSYSQSNVQIKAFAWTTNSDTKRLEEAVNEQMMRPLGVINFGDEYWPRFKFQPMNDDQIEMVVERWNSLLEKGGVKATEADEAYVRDLLGFPKRTEDSKLLREGEEDGNSGDSRKRDAGDGSTHAGDNGVGSSGNSDGDNSKIKPDETIRGKSAEIIYAQFARNKAAKRVAVNVLGKASEVLEKENADKIAMALFDTIHEWLERFELEYPQWDVDEVPKKVKQLRFDSKLVAKVQRATAVMFKDGWKLGQRHAENEIDKAKRMTFSMKYDRKRIEFISEDYFKTKSFKVAGDLTQDAKSKIETIINNGAKTGKTVAEIEAEIYSTFASDGLLAEDVMGALAEVLAGKDIINPQARIDTMVRTNLFEAINEARFSYFTDPALDGFVEAFEYSAVMDSRTTQICQHLDGRIFSAGSEEWNSKRPPNHYNCRSIMIAVTAIDKWTESDPSILEPQKGFG